MNEFVPAATASFTANGGSDGYVTVSDNTPFYPSATAWLSAYTVAQLALSTLAAGRLDTVVKAKTLVGSAGNAITVAAVGDSPGGAGVTLTEVGTAVTIHYESGVSTVANVETKITASSTLIAVKTAGTGATILTNATDNFSATHLASGADHNMEVIITDLSGTTKIGVRQKMPWPTYGKTDVSAFLTADGARISTEGQVVRVIQPTISKVPQV